ncbi:VaFE repeat-containing surface-anchored protein [Enterococcus faecalis]|uniref:VaFE repeat-containing surface-anchored protein n=2 Tax=Enterococcus gallinarum TaxID=1353 RepID=UPI0014306E02|nr:VaFE repeat-containing surface-anchored protein [Enterococcus gallinarum]MBF0726202.1 VaFE repeat-containing surface-anchored protein [Enterococcus gallinarum]MBF0799155.1 VaFE repeat-containing surface-anchored protein [Enterococcus gallinarum]MBF0825542.1 VaFE repeat-containing surface-anchored protein [Enterococcus faecalis]NYS82303.1 VaFE repeat-containing surface-anchored protein [Enterococcus gallinarum]
MQLRTRKKWLKAAVLLAFSQFCFLTGTFQAQAEETTPSQPTVETTTPAPVEAVEVEPVEEAVPATETSAESVPETDAPTTNSKAVLDQTIGETQNPGDSPVCKQPIVVEPSETEDSGESLEEGDPSTTQPSESTEPMDTTEEMTAEDKTTSELSTSTEPSVGEIMDTSDVDTEKIVEKSTDNKDREAESTGKVVVASETKETTLSDKEVEDMFVVTQPRTTRARRATNTANVKMTEVAPKSTEGVYWAEMRLPNGTAFAYDKIDLFEVNGKVAFCIEPGVKGSSGTFTEAALDTYLKNAAVRKKIELIAYFGWEDSKDKSLHRRIATQLFIHEQLKSTPLMVNKVLNYEALKNEINQKIAIFNKKVSFAGKTETVKVGETITVTDKNNSLGNIKDITPSKGITAKIQGNQLVITATKDASEKATITLHKTKLNRTSLVYKQPGKQTISVLGDPTGREVILHLNVLKQGNLEIQKIDADTKKPLANAEIKVTINGKDQTVKTDKNGKAMIKNLTHGTKGSVVEIKAPTGYVLNKTSKNFTIEANKTIKVVLENQEQKGSARIFKEDAETGNNAQGAATLEGAIYGLYQVDGKKIKSVTLKNINGKVQAEVRDLKLGSYYWLEEKAPAGYNLNTNKIHFELVYGDQNKETVTKEVIAKDQVIKGTIEGVKVGNKDFVDANDPDNKPKLAGIEISLTSKTTGKVVKAVLTDKDGYFTFGKHAVVVDTYMVSETKGKEGYKLFKPFEVTISEQGQTFRYVLEDKIIEQQLKIVKVDQETGETIALANTAFKIFDTLANKYVTFAIPNDTEVTDIFRTNDKGYLVTNGTFTYGINRYRIEEINAPINYVLNKTPLVFSITDDTEPIKVINFANRQARKNVKLFKYEEWNKKKTPLVGVTFTLYNGEGKALGEYTTDTNGELLVKGLVAGAYYFKEKAPLESFQPNTDKQAFTVAFKQNAPDDGETLLVSVRNYLIPPTLETQASNKEDGEKIIDPLEKVVIKDSVSYTNLFVGKEYTISGILMNKATNAPILQDGKEIRKTLTFIADKANGTKDLEFVVNASVLKGQTIVVFEKLFRDGIEVAAHEDITDENQSVRVNNPTVHTTAIFEDGLTVADPTGLFTLNDTVEIKEILPGKAYLVKGILMDKATGEALLVHGQPVESAVGFIAKAENETVIVPFTFDLTDLNGREIVVFESLFRNDEELANHKDLEDKGQTVRVTNPSVRTTATHKPTGLKVVNPLTKVTITDAVNYHDLIVGKTYTVNGILMDKATEKPVLVDGKEVTSTLTFVAERTDGTVNLDFVLDARTLRGKEVVVFEDLFREGVLLASHADITDKDQTIKIVNPTITTKATNKNGGKEILALPNQTVLEWAKVDGLAIGHLYKLIVQGYLTPDGTPFEGTHAEKIFTADKATMEFLFEFLVDGRNLAGKGLSFSEWLQAKIEDDKETFEEVAKHNVDLTNKDQTVQIVEAPKPPQPMKPEQPVKEASMVPTLPKTGSEDNVLWIMIGMIFVLAAGCIGYDLYKVKD